jgi:hypothetical protein
LDRWYLVAKRHDLHLQAHAVDDPLKRKSAVWIVSERARRNR